MPQRNLEFLKGHYYHIYNRGVNYQPIFFHRDNYFYLIRLIKSIFEKYNVTIISYCLMPNHYHLLVRPELNEVLSDCMRDTFISYVQAINKRFKRKGPLFEGRFRSILVDEINYVLHLCRYIHLNPVKASLVKFPEDWIFSNFREWIGIRRWRLIDERFIKSNFSNQSKYRKFVVEYQPAQDISENLKEYYLD
ncbi:MAG: transposase [Calditrichia bacterium]|nr:transposase [Calditrichia bacterium]